MCVYMSVGIKYWYITVFFLLVKTFLCLQTIFDTQLEEKECCALQDGNKQMVFMYAYAWMKKHAYICMCKGTGFVCISVD